MSAPRTYFITRRRGEGLEKGENAPKGAFFYFNLRDVEDAVPYRAGTHLALCKLIRRAVDVGGLRYRRNARPAHAAGVGVLDDPPPDDCAAYFNVKT